MHLGLRIAVLDYRGVGTQDPPREASDAALSAPRSNCSQKTLPQTIDSDTPKRKTKLVRRQDPPNRRPHTQ